MDLIERLKTDALAARRMRATGTAALLTTVIAEAERIGKDDGGRAPTEDETAGVVRKFVKNLDETLKHRPDDLKSKVERAELAAYLPQPLAGDELARAITDAAQALGVDVSLKSTKAIMARLNEIHPGRVDGAAVSAVLRKG